MAQTAKFSHDNDVVNERCIVFGILPMEQQMQIRKVRFLQKFFGQLCMFNVLYLSAMSFSELTCLCNAYLTNERNIIGHFKTVWFCLVNWHYCMRKEGTCAGHSEMPGLLLLLLLLLFLRDISMTGVGCSVDWRVHTFAAIALSVKCPLD